MNLKTLLAAALLATAAPAFAAGDAEAGKKKSEPCKACHGENGLSATGDFPILAGQHKDYLIHVLGHYKNGKRKNPIMTGQVANLSTRDIQDLAAYYSGLKGLDVKY
ncbi:cytochrome C [Betaproteobacteria bacterium GR16-43]|nr:cytochrome C [Betaproteobacteria bacterium GR16-43]